VLVVGGGTNGHGLPVYDDDDIKVIAFDIYASRLTQFIADAHRIPLADASVDGVIIQAVLEHVLDPWRVVAEIHRVLRPGGVVYSETPFLQQVHEGPYDFTRFTESGHRWLFRDFDLIESGPIGGPGLLLVWTLDYLVRGLTRNQKVGQRTRRMTRWLERIDRRIPEAHRSDAASAVYFLGRRSETTLTPREIIASYKGAQCPARTCR